MSAIDERTGTAPAAESIPTPVTLRAIAAWLESHPAAEVHYIDFRSSGHMTAIGVLTSYDPSISVRTAEIGGEWTTDGARRREWRITPEATYQLIRAAR